MFSGYEKSSYLLKDGFMRNLRDVRCRATAARVSAFEVYSGGSFPLLGSKDNMSQQSISSAQLTLMISGPRTPY